MTRASGHTYPEATDPPRGPLDILLERTLLGTALLSPDGRFLRANDSLAGLLGRVAEDLIGQPATAVLDPEDRASLRRVLTGEVDSTQLELRLLAADDTTLWTIASLTRLPDDGGQVGWIGQFQDITEQKRTERQLRHRERVLTDAQELARLGSWELDLTTGRLAWSDELCRITGQPLGFSPTYEEFIALVHPDDRAAVIQRVEAARVRRFGDSQYRIVRPSGEVRHVHTRRFGRLNADGELRSVWGTTLDVTDRVQAEEALRQANMHAESILAAMGEGYALTIDGVILAVNDRLCELTGFTREQLTGATMPFPFWPADQLVESRVLRDEIVGAGGGTFEMTVMRADGSRFPGEITAQPARNPDGSLLGFVNLIRDVSAQKAQETEQSALREIAELVAASPDPTRVFEVVTRSIQEVFDAHSGVVVRFEPSEDQGELLSAHTADGHQIVGRTFSLFTPTAAGAVYRTNRPARITAGLADDQLGDYYIQHRITGAAATPVSVNGQLWGALVVSFSDRPVPVDATDRLARFGHLITLALSNAEAWDTLERHARTDALTGLANQRAFSERLAEEVASAAASGAGLCLTLFDLDHFKRVNDTHGHQVGDAVLSEVGEIIGALAREGEMIARIGGEEFGWIMPGADADGAHEAAEAMRHAVAKHAFTRTGLLTVSAGIAELAAQMDAAELIDRADEALYAAKNAGRNTIRTAT